MCLGKAKTTKVIKIHYIVIIYLYLFPKLPVHIILLNNYNKTNQQLQPYNTTQVHRMHCNER